MQRTYLVCRSLQLAGCLQPNTFHPSGDVLDRYLAGATWHIEQLQYIALPEHAHEL